MDLPCIQRKVASKVVPAGSGKCIEEPSSEYQRVLCNSKSVRDASSASASCSNQARLRNRNETHPPTNLASLFYSQKKISSHPTFRCDDDVKIARRGSCCGFRPTQNEVGLKKTRKKRD